MSRIIDPKKYLDAQKSRWKEAYSEEHDFFGEGPSYPAKRAAVLFKKAGITKILELGGGQGRDTFFFAKNGFQVYLLDYCESGIQAINQKAHELGLSKVITTACHDVRKPLPFANDSFEGVYSHMLFCMALTTRELQVLSQETKRILKPDGINIYTARNTKDKHFGSGIHRGEDMYEVGGFIVHFFSKDKIEHLAKGYDIVCVEEFEEGELPRKLYMVTLKKKEPIDKKSG